MSDEYCANSSCGTWLSKNVIYGDLYCKKCKHYTKLRPGKKPEAIIRPLYTQQDITLDKKIITEALTKKIEVTHTNDMT